MALLEFTNRGIYCPQADVYIDPWKPVKRALITHGHGDHARPGSSYYLCTRSARPVIRFRLGPVNIETLEYGESRTINGVRFSFHPAGHVVGSAQIRVEYKGEVWVASGDYKLENDGLTEAFESIPCHTFITECTFGLPIYKWPGQVRVFADINAWWAKNQAEGKVSILTAYALGKAQRLLQGLNQEIGPVFTHGAVENINQILREQGVPLAPSIRLTPEIKKNKLNGGLIIAPPQGINAPEVQRFAPLAIGQASGWMALRNVRKRGNTDRAFVLSDHADWDELNLAVKASNAERIITTHGFTDHFSRWLREQGYQAMVEKTAFEGEIQEESAEE